MNKFMKIVGIFTFCLILFSTSSVWALWDKAHMGTAEDTLYYMETSGSIQQHWVVDYLKAKAGGRNTGATMNANDGEGHGQGIYGIARAGAIVPDYFYDLWWNPTSYTFGPYVTIPGMGKTNFSSWTHFMNLNPYNDENKKIKTDFYNDFDGYSYNGAFGFDETGLDYAVASGMADADMSIDLNKCRQTGECGSSVWTLLPNANPAVDLKQNGSTTPLGTPNGNAAMGSGDGTNYNCFSDTTMYSCPDKGSNVGGFYTPNTQPGAGGGWSDWTGDEDWAVFEPLDNSATFYYNEWWLEGGKSTSTSFDPAGIHSLQKDNIGDRYYTTTAEDLRYLATTSHYCGDANAQVHIWITTGFNHADYELWIDNGDSNNGYGQRQLGGHDQIKNLENYDDITAYYHSRSNDITEDLDNILTENAYLTYLARYRGHNWDVLKNADHGAWRNAGTYAINHTIVSMILLYEKGVLDLRAERTK